MLAILYEASSGEKHLRTSVDAASLAFLHFHFNVPQASALARKKYSCALPLLSSALQQSSSATSDPTLLAILLLDLFEKILNTSPRSTETWMSHANGALALVKQRDYRQPLSHIDVRLGMRFSTILLINCILANVSVPQELTELRSNLQPFVDCQDVKWILSGLVIKYANLRGQIQSSCLSTHEIIKRAAEIDSEFACLATCMPQQYQYTTTYLREDSPAVLERHLDIYLDHLTTQMWNNLRAIRILLQETIRSHHTVRPLNIYQELTTSQNCDAATSTIDDLAKDICAAAPQFYLHGVAFSNTGELPTLQATRCHTLLFSLYVAGLYANPATGIRHWIIERLRFMVKELGIRNAGVVADVLEEGNGTDVWAVYAMLGCYAFSG